ncbi:hypothetical protein ACIHCV_15230 [Streptomyces sp. NPDC051956]|uniref:hypothetical protein n=1 Tax=Streptomyces sp. NPDC051956 TaxID=3365677 RepID=UPI0037CCFC20
MVPWWVLSGVCVLAVGVLGWLRVTLSAKVLGVALILEVLTLLIMDGGILGHRGTAALAVWAFFRRDRRGMSAARMVWSPLIAFAGLALLTVLAVLHFDLLTGASDTVNAVLLAPLPVVLLAGLYIALRIRSRDPQRYAQLTDIDVERD